MLAIASALAASVLVPSAAAHRSPCHNDHACPSDHATYRWNGKLCVARTAAERTPRFKIRIVYAGRVYYCHR